MVRETRLSVDHLIAPLFVVEGEGIEREISSMPGVFHHSVDRLVPAAERLWKLGVPAVMLFGVPATKDAEGSSGWSDAGVVQRGIAALKQALPGLEVIADVCLCEYTDHGHCGVLSGEEVDNDASLPLLARMAVSFANAGADILAPSDMMDGRIGALRSALDEAGHGGRPVMSYAAKYASAFYGPFRDAAQSTPASGDRRGYQMDPANRREALREVALDLEEGADLVMVKPALSYLDVISDVRRTFDAPVVAYNVSGEYAMVKAAGRAGWLDEERIMMELLLSIRRAGADLIVSYHAGHAAQLLG